jgi:AAA15 family ATPase/GTPase
MIHSLEIQNFRCFQSLPIEHCKRFNVIVGDNGVGKTAMLEAIFLALASNPTIALRYRVQRGLESAFGGQLRLIEEAMWRDLFYRGDWDKPLSVTLKGDGVENRTVIVSRGAQTEIPFGEAEQLEGRLSGVQFRWINAAGKEITFVPKVSATGLALGDTEEEYLPDFFYFAANQTIGAGENAGRFSELSRAGKLPDFMNAVKLVYPWIIQLNIEIVASLPTIYATLDTGEQYPLGFVSGGVNRVISVLLALSARPRATICVDEVEDGIFYKHQARIWGDIVSLARKQESQLFVTTHSEEWLEAAFADGDLSDTSLWRVTREGGKPVLRQFSGKQIAITLDSSGEIR